ncbi:MAG: hypothetical protein ACRD63_00340 [Pyrinomonadaceae bacterium]
MKKLILSGLALILSFYAAQAQGSGIDPQSNQIRETGASRAPGVNGTKQDTGAGRGIDFGRGKGSRVSAQLPNPYTFQLRKDAVLKAVVEVMQDSKLIEDDSASKPDDGLFVSQPYTFSKGAVLSTSQISQYALLIPEISREWTRGRYTLIIQIQPMDALKTNVSVNSKVEGRTDGASGAEWTTLKSSGLAENNFLLALVVKITGAPPPNGGEQK